MSQYTTLLIGPYEIASNQALTDNLVPSTDRGSIVLAKDVAIASQAVSGTPSTINASFVLPMNSRIDSVVALVSVDQTMSSGQLNTYVGSTQVASTSLVNFTGGKSESIVLENQIGLFTNTSTNTAVTVKLENIATGVAGTLSGVVSITYRMLPV